MIWGGLGAVAGAASYIHSQSVAYMYYEIIDYSIIKALHTAPILRCGRKIKVLPLIVGKMSVVIFLKY